MAAVVVAVVAVAAVFFVYRHHRRGASRSANAVVEVQMQSIAAESQAPDRGRNDGGEQGLL